MEPLQLTKPHLIILVGIPGAGKSFFAEHFAETFKSPIISSQIIRTRLFKIPNYSKEEDEIIDIVTDYLLDEVLKTNRTVVYRGKSGSRLNRAELLNKCQKAGYEPMFVWVQTDSATAKKRYLKLANIDTEVASGRFDTELKKFAPPQINERLVVISGKHTYDSQLKIVLKRLIGHDKPAATPRTYSDQIDKRSFLIR